MRPLRAVVLEDDENDLLLMTEALERYGFALESTWVRDANSLRAALETFPCDVVLADYRLPGFNGSDALDLVRSMGLDVPFILVTATLGDELAAEMMRRGASDYVLKDRLARLGFAVARAVDESQARRETQQELAAVQRRFQQTFDHAPIGIIHTGNDGRLRMVNDRFCSIVGYSREELQRMTFLDITHPDDLISAVRGWEETRTSGRGVYRAEKRYIRKDGEVIWADVSATVIRDTNGEIDYTLAMVKEITARKLAEEKIRRQGVLLDAVVQAVIATDVSGRITYWSRFARDLYGWSEDEVLGRNIYDLTAPTLSAADRAALLARLASGESWTGELTLERRDGTRFPAMLIGSAIFDPDGSVAGLVGVSFDLSGQKAAEAALRRTDQRLRDVIEGVAEIIISVSRDATICSVNRGFEVASGWTRGEIVGQKLWTLLPADQAGPAAARLEKRLQGENLAISGELLRKDGSPILIDGVAYVAHHEDGTPEVFYFLRDVTDRTRAEEERARLDRQFRLVLESTDEGIYAVDADGICTLMNRAAAQALGFAPEEILGRRLHDYVHFAHADGTEYPIEECPVYRTVRYGATERVRNEVFWRSDGRPMPVEYASAPVLANGATIGAVVTFTDVSQRRMLESQLEKANRLNGLGRIAATIAHEFNNVLMGIQPFVEVLRIEGRGNERMQRAVERITDSVRRGKRVTSEILQFTRQSEPVKKPLDVGHWLGDLAAEARQVVGPGIELIVHSEPGLTVAGDSSALQQVFMNMIVNARDALNAGTGLIVISAEPSEGSVFAFGAVEHGETFAHFTITDNGPGMSAETMQHIFEPLFTTKKSGTGLGLALSHHVVQQHGGSLFVESTEGDGTTFHIFLPLADEAERELPPSATQRPANLRSLVLVEDDVIVAAGMVELLGMEQIRVQVARTGGEALETIERARPDAVVLDVGLPDMDGTAVYENIARRWPEMPVVFATGHADASRLREYLTEPNVGHVLKPYQLETLYQVFAALLLTSSVS